MPPAKPQFDSIVHPYSEATIDVAAALIRQGQPVAVPTETVYGLASDATNGIAVARIYTAKGRPAFNPLIVHVSDLSAAERIGIFDNDARALAERFWPGPLTLVVPLHPESGIASLVTAGLPTVAIRVSTHRAMRALLDATGKPLAAPSANRSGALSPTLAVHVERSLGNSLKFIIDDGPCSVGIESTIVAVSHGRVQLLRAGPVMVTGAFGPDSDITGVIESPGQLASHYAPRKPLRIDAVRPQADEWLIGFGRIVGNATLSAAGDLTEAAARLFERLHEADASESSRLAVAPIPNFDLGEAINDRLRRAAS